MQKDFYEAVFFENELIINKLVYPADRFLEDGDPFLVYAENKGEAYHLALEYYYEKKKLEKFYGTYNGEKYYGEIKCVI